MNRSRAQQALIIAAAVVLLGGAAFSANTTFAAKGGNSGGGQTGGGSATLTVSPNPVPASSWFHISGCGYAPGQGVTLNLHTSSAVATTGTQAGSDGCLNVDWYSHAAGTYTLYASTGSRNTVVASITFQVY
jgi:hypothetical protein